MLSTSGQVRKLVVGLMFPCKLQGGIHAVQSLDEVCTVIFGIMMREGVTHEATVDLKVLIFIDVTALLTVLNENIR